MEALLAARLGDPVPCMGFRHRSLGTVPKTGVHIEHLPCSASRPYVLTLLRPTLLIAVLAAASAPCNRIEVRVTAGELHTSRTASGAVGNIDIPL